MPLASRSGSRSTGRVSARMAARIACDFVQPRARAQRSRRPRSLSSTYTWSGFGIDRTLGLHESAVNVFMKNASAYRLGGECATRRPMISTGDFKRGLRILVDGEPWVILDVHVQSPSARGASSLSKLKIRNLRTGQVLDRTFRGGDRVDEPDLELCPVQFLYRDDDGFHFMDTQSYEQFSLGSDDLSDAAGYLRDGLDGIRSVVFNGKAISIDLPNTVALRVVDTAPALKGATAQAQAKPATLETGLVIQVPSYLESDEVIVVDTREARFVSRAKG